MARSDNFTLPNADEIMHILSIESQRQTVRLDYVSSHPKIFDGLRELSRYAQLDINWIYTYKQVSLQNLLLQIQSSFNAAKSFLLTKNLPISVINNLYDCLSPQQTLKKADIIFVFGSPSDVRIHKAIELYKNGYAP